MQTPESLKAAAMLHANACPLPVRALAQHLVNNHLQSVIGNACLIENEPTGRRTRFRASCVIRAALALQKDLFEMLGIPETAAKVEP